MHQLAGKSILVVDDEPALRAVLADDFRDFASVVEESSSGVEAYSLVQRKRYDAVISDVRMANGTGIELLAWIMALPEPRPPVILVSGYSDLSVKDALAKGAAAVFGKPYDLDALTAAVIKAVGG